MDYRIKQSAALLRLSRTEETVLKRFKRHGSGCRIIICIIPDELDNDLFDNILNRQIAADIPVGGFVGELLEQLQQILFILTEPEARLNEMVCNEGMIRIIVNSIGQHFKAYAVFCHRIGEIRNLLVHNIWTGHVKCAGKYRIFKAVCYQEPWPRGI